MMELIYLYIKNYENKNDLDTELKRLYNHHIGHSFAKNSSPQERLEKQMQNTLVKYSLDRHYKPKVLSDGLVETRIPFVSQSKQGVLAARRYSIKSHHPNQIMAWVLAPAPTL